MEGGDQYFVVVQWGKLVKVGQFFLDQLQKQPTEPHFTEHKFSYSCYVMIDHHVIPIFYIFLASFHPHNILRLPSYFYYTQCDHIFEK